MASVVIVHAAEDALPARALAEKLRAANLTPVLEKYGAELRDAARAASVSIALWSPRSVGSASLIEDVASVAKGKLVHASMQNAAPPPQFVSEKQFNLTGWRGEDDFRPWRELADEVTSKAGVAPLPEPPARGGAAFFQPGRVQPETASAVQQQQTPRPAAAPRPQPRPAPRSAPEPRHAPTSEADKKGSPIGIIAVVLLVLAALGGGGYWYLSQSQGQQASAAAWEDVAKNDADEIRAFLAGDPGDFRDEAEAALAELDQQTFDSAQEADSIEAFEAFLAEFPNSDNALAARGRIAELRANPPATPDASTTDAATPDTPVDPDLVPPGAVTAPEPQPETGAPGALVPPVTPDPGAPITP